MSKVVLGRGLEALIPTQAEGTSDSSSGDVRALPLDSIAPNPHQPRKSFDPESLKELADSIKTRGLLQPILVVKETTGYILVAGERRYRAARMAGIETIPALVLQDVSPTDMLQIALIENIQRENLNPIETAVAYQTLIETCGLTQAQLAEQIGKSRTAITNTLRLLTLPEHIRSMIADGKLSEGHARAILSISDPVMRDRVAGRIVNETLTVRQAEGLAGQAKRRSLSIRRKPPIIEETETYLKHTLGTSVKIMPGLKKGHIVIEYYGEEDLTRLVDLFRKIS